MQFVLVPVPTNIFVVAGTITSNTQELHDKIWHYMKLFGGMCAPQVCQRGCAHITDKAV